jgi:hypothetical protein
VSVANLDLSKVISAGSTWQENMEYAIRLVSQRGGAMAVINEEGGNFTRRFLVENLVVHDIFSKFARPRPDRMATCLTRPFFARAPGCFVTNKEPALLVKFDPWWFECQETSRTRWEWESVERT